MLALLTALVSTCFMTGLVWFCQIVQYPLLGVVGAAPQLDYHRQHMIRTLPLVTIPMVLEGASGVALLAGAAPTASRGLAWLAFALSLVIWGSTLIYQAPQHFSLVRHFTPEVHAELVRCNWIRTIAWSARLLIIVWMLRSVLR